MRRVVFRHHQQTTGKAVDAVDDSWTYHAVNAGKAVAAVIKQSVYQCSGRMSRCRVDNHPFGLVDNQKVIVFIHNVQRNVFRLKFQRFRLRQRHENRIPCLLSVVFGDGSAVDRHIPMLHPVLQGRTCQTKGILSGKPLVQAFPIRLRRHEK